MNKVPNFENTNQKLFLDENKTFKYDTQICPNYRSHKIIKNSTITKNKQISMENDRIKRTTASMQKCGKNSE